MPPAADETTLLPRRRRSTADRRETSTGLPTDIVDQSVTRLRALALLYSAIFFLAGFFPALLFPEDRARILGTFVLWFPGAISIAAGLGVFLLLRLRTLSRGKVMALGLGFEVLSSYGIAAAEFLGNEAFGFELHWLGLSWVAVWVVLFTIVIPTPPRRAVVAALASVSSVPVMMHLALRQFERAVPPTSAQFFFGAVFPYLLVVAMAYVGARVVYALGTEVMRARELGSYQLVERLGQGGMGEVWSAKHRLLARPAAIKLIRPGSWGQGGAAVADDAQKRFEREAQAIAQLRSPHTVTIFDFGVASDGAFYYVMELLDGLDAETLVRKTGPIPAERAIHLLVQTCHSLSEADSYGLVHRDIKPANIFLCRYGEDVDFVKVLDFGIVKSTGEAATEHTALTRAMAVQGTPAFMAPEQALGSPTIDGRADIYATGCVAHWLLTGQRVFEGETPMALLIDHAHTPARRPSSCTDRSIPPALDDLVLACLAKDPANRPQTARELSARLSAIQTPEAWTADRARRWWDEHAPARV
jgi:serine/threonine-protein kinase